MTRHELLPDQTATPISRPANHLAPVDGCIVIAVMLDRICHHNAASLASLSLNAAQVPTLRRHLPTVAKSVESRKTHSAQSVTRGFGLPGLSGAYRQPKLFREEDGRLPGWWEVKLPPPGSYILFG